MAQGGAFANELAIERWLLFGTSLNAIGKKQSFIVEVGEDVRATVVAAFDSAWSPATVV